MSDKQQSAVDWLVENYLPLKRGLELKEPNVIKTINQAKEMHKQESENDYVAGGNYARCCSTLPKDIKESHKQYFNDKFKTESNGK